MRQKKTGFLSRPSLFWIKVSIGSLLSMSGLTGVGDALGSTPVNGVSDKVISEQAKDLIEKLSSEVVPNNPERLFKDALRFLTFRSMNNHGHRLISPEDIKKIDTSTGKLLRNIHRTMGREAMPTIIKNDSSYMGERLRDFYNNWYPSLPEDDISAPRWVGALPPLPDAY